MRPRVLVVAAEKFELEWIRRSASTRTDAEFTFVSNGPGPKLAAEAVDRAGQSFDAFVSVGLCGGLIDQATVGTIVIGDAVNGAEAQKPQSTEALLTGPIASIDRIAFTRAEKQQLRDTGAIAVEMEAAAVQERAQRLSRPFYCVKAVSDTADEEFALDLNAARDEAGRFRVRKILAQAALRPLVILPELRRLLRNSRLATRALGGFFEHCRF